MELKTYGEAANPVKATAYHMDSMDDTTAVQRTAHKVGMQALENRWEAWWD